MYTVKCTYAYAYACARVCFDCLFYLIYEHVDQYIPTNSNTHAHAHAHLFLTSSGIRTSDISFRIQIAKSNDCLILSVWRLIPHAQAHELPV
jgi:hypothetical protein